MSTVSELEDSKCDRARKGFKRLNTLVWFDDYEVGWFPVHEDGIYDQGYFDNFNSYRKTDLGVSISSFRTQFVRSRTDDSVIDIGAGAGHFLEMINSCSKNKSVGFDINPASVHWLKDHDLFHDIHNIHQADALTFWDSLEHIPKFWQLLRKVRIGGFVFMTIPIFDNGVKGIKESKHFKPREHYWYFSSSGLISFMDDIGFILSSVSDQEVKYGREGVLSFAFQKVLTV